MQRGYFKFWRKAQDSSSWNRGLMYQGLMINLLNRAAWKTGSYQGKDILPGQFGAVISQLSESLCVPRSTLQRMVAHLEADGFLAVENVGNRFSVITIVNWSSYQSSENDVRATDGQPMVNQRATDGQPYLYDTRVFKTEEVKKEEKKENTNVFLSPAEADDAQGPTEDEPEQSGKNGVSPCPHRKIIEIYHEVLPELPRVRVWNGKGEKSLSARWKEKLLDLKEQGLPYDEAAGLEWWRKFFVLRVRASPLLMGKVTRQNGGAWIASLRWLVLPENFVKTFEGNYLDRRPA